MKILFNEGFSFLLMDKGSCFADFLEKKENACPVLIPHDWAVGDFDLFYKDGVGFYIKDFSFAKKESMLVNGGHVFVRFDGVYMDSSVYLNGQKIYEWKYGYTSFVVELTDYLIDGDNELVVMVNFQNPNSRWYSGAGIYRDIWWIENDSVYVPDGGVYVSVAPEEEKAFDKKWNALVDITLNGTTDNISSSSCNLELLSDGNKAAIENVKCEVIADACAQTLDEGSQTLDACAQPSKKITCSFDINEPKLWSPENPNLYTLKVSLLNEDNQIIQVEEETIGFRFVEFTCDKGLFINGNYIKLNGVCEHHDFGCLGACFYADALDRKIDKLKAMGVNAIRTSHNPAPRQFYEECDKRGILVDAEAFDMWERPKTTYDYGRFFPEWYKKDVERWVLDARNHPSVIMWSIGNEIYDTHAGERGREVAKNLTDAVREYDPRMNARVTLGSNYMPWENTQRVADDLKLIGYNYAESFYPEHHEKHPDWIIYGSETSSVVYSRGVYHFPISAGILSDDDLQCSSLGNSTTSWGAASIEKCIYEDSTMDYSLGQFLWTGFDYLGEPTPYHTKNSYFGQLDTAGFCKDPYYMWKAAWVSVDKEPFVHIFPYWNFNPGQKIDIRVTSNAYAAELFVNGVSLGKKEYGKEIILDYSAVYAPGCLMAVAYDKDGNEIARDYRYSFGNTDHIEVKKNVYGKLVFYELQAVDCDGHCVEDANDYLKVSVKNGILLGLDNGDSTDYDSYQLDVRRMFRGKLLAVVREEGEASEINVDICKDKIPVRAVILEAQKNDGAVILTKDEPSVKLVAHIVPEDATNKELIFRLTDSHGNDSRLATISTEKVADDVQITVTGVGDGDFILKAISNDGEDHARVISQLEIKTEGLGTLFTDPYSFVPGSTYSRSIGSVANGNERGLSTGRDGETTIIFEDVDFGDIGTSSIEIPIFALNDDVYVVQIWDGVEGEEGASLICDGRYQKPSIWNTYQAETFDLMVQLTGVRTISFKVYNKIHFKGFICKKTNPVYMPMWAGFAPDKYGDAYLVEGSYVNKIGNNVTIGYGKHLLDSDIKSVTIFGRANNGINTLHVRLRTAAGEVKEVVEFKPTPDYDEQTFDISGFEGEGELSVIFMPGCDFDLGWIRFNR